MAEKLAFILTTILSDVTVLSESNSQTEIVSSQLEVLQRISEAITEAAKNPQLADQHKKGFITGIQLKCIICKSILVLIRCFLCRRTNRWRDPACLLGNKSRVRSIYRSWTWKSCTALSYIPQTIATSPPKSRQEKAEHKRNAQLSISCSTVNVNSFWNYTTIVRIWCGLKVPMRFF
jgi:hypothetical protein